uniref:Uncharacterized protein n=1 Tax=Magallana gigas TaxID=29159 RepID=K1Q5R3_MAGGI
MDFFTDIVILCFLLGLSDAESVLNGAKDQLREIKSLEKNLGISVKEFKNLMWHDEGIDEESEPKNLKDELFSEVNKRVAKDPKDKPDDDDDDEPKKRRIESAREKQNRLFTETNKVLNDDAKKALTQVKDRVRAMKKPTDKKKDGKFGKGWFACTKDVEFNKIRIAKQTE